MFDSLIESICVGFSGQNPMAQNIDTLVETIQEFMAKNETVREK